MTSDEEKKIEARMRRLLATDEEVTELVPEFVYHKGEIVEMMVERVVPMTDILVNGEFKTVRVDSLEPDEQADIILPIGRVRGSPERWRTLHRTRLARLRKPEPQ